MKSCENKENYQEANEILAKCEKCNGIFIQKYWDDEIDWYIEICGVNTCHKCSPT